MTDATPTKNVILTEPKRGQYNICVTLPDGTFHRFEASRNDVCEIMIKGASVAYRYTEEMS